MCIKYYKKTGSDNITTGFLYFIQQITLLNLLNS